MKSNCCPICYETLSGTSLLPCGHRFHSQCLFEFWQTKYTELCPCPMCRHPIKDTNIINLVQMDILQNRIDRETSNNIEQIISLYYDYKWKESNREENIQEAERIEPIGFETRFINAFSKIFSPIISLLLFYLLIGFIVLSCIEVTKYILEIRPVYIYNYIRFSLSMLKYKLINMDIVRFAIYTFRPV